MSNREKYEPKHRAPGKHKRKRDPLGALRTSASRPAIALTGLAVAVTGTAVATGVVGSGSPDVETTAGAQTVGSVVDDGVTGKHRGEAASEGVEITSDYIAQRVRTATRSDRRESQDQFKLAALTTEVGVVTAHERKLSDENPRDIARTLMADFGFSDSEFGCLDKLWTKESNWRWDADNPSSSAYGIPQALPGSKMSSAGADWATNPATQITWGLGYIKGRYGTPCAAWSHSQARGWY